MRRMRVVGSLLLALTVPAAISTIASASDPELTKRVVARSGDRDYATEIHRRLLGREPSADELDVAIRGFRTRPHRIREQNRLLDSPEFRSRVGDAAFVFGLVRQTKHRDPLLHELLLGLHLLEEGVPRSELLGGLLVPQDRGPRAETLRARAYDDMVLDFRQRKLRRYEAGASKLTGLADARQRERLLDEAALLGGALPGPPEPPLPTSSGSEDPRYPVFFGYLHAHTDISYDARVQGSPGPFAAYEQARFVAGLDFMGLSDHAEFISVWPWNHEWNRLEAAADAYNEDGAFVALRGFEYSNPFYGHINVFGTEEFTSTWFALTLRKFYGWLSLRPQAAATFNHPGTLDWLGIELLHFDHYPEAARQMAGMEILTHLNESGAPDDFDRYSVGFVDEDGLGFLDEAIQSGWRVAGLSAQDNHMGTWGVLDDYRTGVLATRLTREALLDAIRRRRFYSTQDKNLILSFRADGKEMGSVLDAGDKVFRVELDDEDGEGFVAIDLHADGRLIETRSVSGVGSWRFPVAASGDAVYYYVVVTQEDGDRAISAPIWVRAP